MQVANTQRGWTLTSTAGLALFLTMFVAALAAAQTPAQGPPDDSHALLTDPAKDLGRQFDAELRKLENSELVGDYIRKLDVLRGELIRDILGSGDYPVLSVDDFDESDVWVIENIVNVRKDREAPLKSFTPNDLEYIVARIPPVRELHELKSHVEQTTDALDFRRVEFYGWLDDLESLCLFFRDHEKVYPAFTKRIAEAIGLTFEAEILEIRFDKAQGEAERDAIRKELRAKLNQSLSLLIELRGEYIAIQEAVIAEAKGLLEKARAAGAPPEQLENRLRKVSDMESNLAYWKRGLALSRDNAALIVERRMVNLELRELDAFPDDPFKW